MITVQVIEGGRVINQFEVEGNQTQAQEEDFPEYLQDQVGSYLAGQEEMSLEEYLTYQAGTVSNNLELSQGSGIRVV